MFLGVLSFNFYVFTHERRTLCVQLAYTVHPCGRALRAALDLYWRTASTGPIRCSCYPAIGASLVLTQQLATILLPILGENSKFTVFYT